jgi:adenine-specific DNA methylase
MTRAIEVGFPIVEINRLAVPERNSFKPIYQMHKWFARRASCVFRAILLGALKPAFGPDGKPTDLMEEFYKDHTDDPDTTGKVILDPFMGGGTTVVEALRLGCKVIGIDLNPVAWFIVKTEIQPVDLDELQAAFERLAQRPVDWNGGRPLRDTLLDLYKTEVRPGVEADIIYTFWVKHAICTDQNCRCEVPLFKNYIIAQKTVSVSYYRDVTCPHCGAKYDWDIEVASLIANAAMMIDAPRGSSGEGRPSAAWSYAPITKTPGKSPSVQCPRCPAIAHPRLSEKKKHRKKVPLTVLLCPACEAVWQWRGTLPHSEVNCPACKHQYDPLKGNVPEKGKFLCPQCGAKDKIIHSLRTLPQDRCLPIRPYALQAYLPTRMAPHLKQHQSGLFGNRGISEMIASNSGLPDAQLSAGLLLPRNGKFFTRFTTSDRARLIEAENLWGMHKDSLPYPKSEIPLGEKTKSGLLAHHYNHWHEIFQPRQLLALSTLLRGITTEGDQTLREMLLCAFSNTLEGNNLFVRNIPSRTTPGGTAPAGVFARHDFQPKATSCEQNVWGTISGNNTFISRMELIKQGIRFREKWSHGGTRGKPLFSSSNAAIASIGAQEGIRNLNVPVFHVITDPPYVGNVNYAELADFFYVWLRLALKISYAQFAPEYTPKTEEIIQNAARGKSETDFYDDLSAVFASIKLTLSNDGLIVFTFHHTDQEGTIWEGMLRSLCQEGFEIIAVYPIHGEREASLHLQDKENISYDLIHVCRKRREDSRKRSWAGIRQEVRRRAREELQAIESGRYGNARLSEPDVRLICIGKCLELFSAHYGLVIDHQGEPVSLHAALQDIGTIVDQLVTRDRPLPPELEEGIDSVSYAWLRVLRRTQREIQIDELNKGLRAMQVTAEDLKEAGLIVRGRTGRGRTYEVKLPHERLNSLLEKLKSPMPAAFQRRLLFDEEGEPVVYDVSLVDLVHLLVGLAKAGESVSPWLERFSRRRPQLRAALRFLRDERPDWVEIIDRILPIIEGTPLLQATEKN